MFNITSDNGGNMMFSNTTLKATVEMKDQGLLPSASWITSPRHAVGSRYVTFSHLSQFVSKMKTWKSGFFHFD
jgi:hypothetical protein